MNNRSDWTQGFPAAITVCDRDGVIIEMNEKARLTFGPEKKLVGTNVLDCHPEPARSKVKELLAAGRSNAYTIDKKGVKQLIYKAPWYDDGEFAGLVELSVEIPPNLPNYVRG